MKNILGLDLGTNSIGWAVVEQDEDDQPIEIEGLGSRIIPMSQDIIGTFEGGNSFSQTSERTGFRGSRRLRERYMLRRERLHRVLHIIHFLPEHYDKSIDFTLHLGKFINELEPKLAWRTNELGCHKFIFMDSFKEMLEDFHITQPQLLENGKMVPYDWTIYYLRKKALSEKIEKEELAWILLNFNQKRGYYQLRGEEENINTSNKTIKFHELKVVNVSVDDSASKTKGDVWYNITLENGWNYKRSSKYPLNDLIGKTKDFIVTTDYNKDGSFKKRSFRLPSSDDWTLIKKKTESDLVKSGKTVGTYIYDTLLQNPKRKIIGQLIRTIERNFYRQELEQILDKQISFYPELQDKDLLEQCLLELYKNNEAHRNTINDFKRLFINDIIFYQRPLKSKKSLISDCPFESRSYMENGKILKKPIKCIPRSHPLYQEFRLWQFVRNMRIYAKEKYVDNHLQTDVDVTTEFLPDEESYTSLFDWLNDKKEIKESELLKSYFKIKTSKNRESELPFRWNYVSDKAYPCNNTRAIIKTNLNKVSNIPDNFLSTEKELEIWHILYSIVDKYELEKALCRFAKKNQFGEDFVDVFKKTLPFDKDYGGYSEKSLKKLLPLMRMGKYWSLESIDSITLSRIDKIITGEFDETIKNKVREKAINLTNENDFKGLPLWLASYIVYNRHSEISDNVKWERPEDIDLFLKEFKQYSLRNPIVEQVITETLRVVRDIWKRYGDLSEIHIELGREMKNPADKRKRMMQTMLENEESNLRIKRLLIEMMEDSSIENVRPYSPNQQEILRIYEEGVLSSNIEVPDEIFKITKQNAPSRSELTRYRLWLDQKYRSPYTGKMIPLSKLFTNSYEIEHIIPQARYFDDSYNNKVICEAEVNRDKEDCTAYEYIKNNGGKIIELSFGNKVEILKLEEYEKLVKDFFSKNKGKMTRLLMDDVPDDFINRQLNDSRYVSKYVKSLLSNIVRESNEEEATSKNLISCNGSVTTRLKQDWGLNDVWNNLITPRFERLNQMTDSNQYGSWENKFGKRVFQIEVPLDQQKGFNKKRIDHRHHALDALVIACATRNHINYLNNEHAHKKDKSTRYDLRNKLRRLEEVEIEKVENGQSIRKKIKVAKEFIKPWNSFTQDAQNALEGIIVSFKQNTRVINKTVNRYQHYVDGKKVLDKQTKGDSWAIRKSLHKATVSGLVNLRLKKEVSLSAALNNVDMMVDKALKNYIKLKLSEGLDKKKILKELAEKDNILDGHNVSRTEIYYFSNDVEPLAASRIALDSSFDKKKISSVTDTGIQRILLKHLTNYGDDSQQAFSPEGIAEMNNNIQALNEGIPHQAVIRVRTFETLGNKFQIGNTGNKKSKYVETDKGTVLFFAIYQDNEGKRSYESIPLNIVIENLKQNLPPVVERKFDEQSMKEKRLKFFLSPNDLVYVPTVEELENNIVLNAMDFTTERKKRIYKMVSSTGRDCFFNYHRVSSSIANKFEFSPLNKMERAIDGAMIKEVCWKLQTDRLGNITAIIK